MFEAICLLTAGLLIGRLWAWLKSITQPRKHTRYTVQRRTWDALDEISELRRQGQEAMYQAVNERRRR